MVQWLTKKSADFTHKDADVLGFSEMIQGKTTGK
jgi:hypothetical protein